MNRLSLENGPPLRGLAPWIAQLAAKLEEPVHGQGGWELAKYEWREDGTGRFLYVRNTGERREVIRRQTGWCV